MALPHQIISDHTLHPFLFMGCWNKEGPARDAVASAIHARPEKLLILGGDNIYPEKTPEGKKVYNAAILDRGHRMLGDKIIYVTLGNHNVSDPTIRSHELTDMPATYGHSWIIPHSYYTVT